MVSGKKKKTINKIKRQEGQENSGEVTGQKPSTQSCGPFYATVQTQTSNGDTYTVASYFGIRAGISGYFPRFDIMNCDTFKASNDVFKSVIKKQNAIEAVPAVAT